MNNTFFFCFIPPSLAAKYECYYIANGLLRLSSSFVFSYCFTCLLGSSLFCCGATEGSEQQHKALTFYHLYEVAKCSKRG